MLYGQNEGQSTWGLLSGSSFHRSVDRQPFMGVQERYARGKRENVSEVQGSMGLGSYVYGRCRGWQDEVWQRPGLEVPERALIVQHFVSSPADFALGAPEQLLLLGSLRVQLSQLLIFHKLGEERACPAASMGSFASGFLTVYKRHRIVKITNSISCLQQKVAQNY